MTVDRCRDYGCILVNCKVLNIRVLVTSPSNNCSVPVNLC
jgi:hypothetical protein